MKSGLYLVALLALSVTVVEARKLIVEASNAKAYPVSKVIKLLKDMQTQLEKEAEEDEEAYDKMACWCETNDKDKTKSILDAEARVADLTTVIESTAAQSARLHQEITNHEEDLAKANEALSQATSLREKAAAEFNDEEKDLLQSVKALDSAIIILSKHHKTAFLDASTIHTVTQVMRVQMKKHHNLFLGSISPHQRKLVLASVDEDQNQAPHLQTYQPASGEIFGILKQMKETFETNLSDSQKQELADQKTYEDLKAAKEAEIKAITDAIDEKKQQLAVADEKNAQSKDDIEDTNNGLTVDERFLMDLKTRCASTDEEWEARKKMRQEEISAVAEAISILSADEAHDTFSKTFNPASLLQKVQRTDSKRRQAAADVLIKAAGATHNPKLVTLASTVRLDAFTKVKQAIDEMVAELAQAKKDDQQHRDSCVEELNQNSRQNERETRTKEQLEAQIEGLESALDQINTNVETLTSEISDLQVQMKRFGEDRAKENSAFQVTLSDQRETQELLHKALAVLQAVYAEKSTVVRAEPEVGALLQTQALKQNPPPPPGFDSYEANQGAGGVVAMLEQIISDAKAMETDTIRAEEDAQKQYEDFVKDTNAAVSEKSKAIVDKNEDKANTERDLAQARIDLRDTETELMQLSNNAGALHMSCDFLMKNFDMRQEAFDQEMDALKQAKAILSGMQAE